MVESHSHMNIFGIVKKSYSSYGFRKQANDIIISPMKPNYPGINMSSF